MDLSRTRGLRALAPRSVPRSSSDAAKAAASQQLALSEGHTAAEWAAMYPHIQRLYVQERRKLRYVMQHMEEKYGFKATSQMYKKRFAKWGFHKNIRSSRRENRRPVATAHSELRQRKVSIDLPVERPFCGTDAYNLLFLCSIRTWSSAFFETALRDSSRGDPDFMIPTRVVGDQPLDLEQLSFSFRLVAELLRRGYGAPAGRPTRKAFLQVEKILDLEGPLVIWNLLETLYNIAYLGQTRLFGLLICHISNLAGSRFPKTYPLSRILGTLQDAMRRMSPDDSFLDIIALIERAWLLNAHLIFSNVHWRFQLMYHHLIWDSKQLRLPPEAPRQLSEWYRALCAENPRAVQAAADLEDLDTQHLERLTYATLAFPTDAGYAQRSEPPDNYHRLKIESVSDLQKQSKMEAMDQNLRFQVLVGQMKSGIPDSYPRLATTIRDDDDVDGPALGPSQWSPSYERVPRLHVRVVAFMAKIALDTYLDLGISGDVGAEKLRGIIALREYGQGAVDPQVVYEFWQLRDVLAGAGRLGEAAEAGREASKRLEIYLADIPETFGG